MKWTAELIVTGFGLANEAPIFAAAPIEWATNRTGGGAQQPITIKVILLLNTNRFVQLVILIQFLTSFSARPPGNR